MSPADPSKKLAGLLKRLRSRYDTEKPCRISGADVPAREAIVDELVYSILMWEASSNQAKAAFKRLHEAFVDYNDLRAAIDEEIVDVLGEKFPLAMERARRLRAALHDIYRRQHGVSLGHLVDLSKRDAKAYLESLEGVPVFASHRVLLGELHVHAVPVDERLRDLLAAEGVLDEANDVNSATSFLERNIHAEETLQAAASLQAWSDDEGQPPKREKRAPAPTVEIPVKPAPKKAEPKPAKPATAKKTKAKGKTGG